MELLTLNCGSSTVKAARYACGDDGALDGGPLAHVVLETADVGVAAAVEQALDEIGGGATPQAVGHRVVHGGPDLSAPVRIDDAVVDVLEGLVPLAPLHQPPALAGIAAARTRLPDAVAVACFDTAFHHGQSEVVRTLPLPRRLAEAGLRRYGFHGLSYEFVVAHLGAEALGRAVIAHLGSGASLCAVAGGRSVATTMGFTPTGGVVMGTRSGDLDPGALVHVMRAEALDADGLESLVDHDSGLVGISGLDNDERLLERAAAEGHAGARLALEVFARSVRQALAALTTDLGGLDSVVFTAGIGAHSPLLRSMVCDGLEHLGVTLDPVANERGDAVVSTGGSAVTVHVVRTDEERVIATHTARLATSPLV